MTLIGAKKTKNYLEVNFNQNSKYELHEIEMKLFVCFLASFLIPGFRFHSFIVIVKTDQVESNIRFTVELCFPM